jgi:glycosyltransferase involved in cell wall biosynthesis
LSHSSAVDNLGGAERSMLEFLDQWREADHAIELFVISRSPEGLLQPELDRRGIPWMNLDFTSTVSHRRAIESAEIYDSARQDFAAVRAVERFITEFGADLVVTNTIVAPWAALAAKFAGVPHIWFAHEYGDGHEFQIPASDVFEDIGILSDLVVASSQALREHLIQWIEPEKIAVLYPPILSLETHGSSAGAATWPFAATVGRPPLRLICVGRLTPSKGQARLIRSVAALRDEGVRVEAALVGSATDVDRSEIEHLITQLGVGDRVALTGELDDLGPFYAAADAGVVISDSEGFGRSTVELMAAGRAVIGADVGATTELVVSGTTGTLVPPGNAAALNDAIRAYSSDRDMVASHGLAAGRHLREVITKRHRVGEVITRMNAIASSGSASVSRIPNIVDSWMTLPDTAIGVLNALDALLDPRTSWNWRIGNAVLAGPRVLANALKGRRP